MTNCIVCLNPLEPGVRHVIVTMDQDITLHSVRYPAGSKIVGHTACIRVVPSGDGESEVGFP